MSRGVGETHVVYTPRWRRSPSSDVRGGYLDTCMVQRVNVKCNYTRLTGFAVCTIVAGRIKRDLCYCLSGVSEEGVLICCLPQVVWPSTTHSFRDGAPLLPAGGGS